MFFQIILYPPKKLDEEVAPRTRKNVLTQELHEKSLMIYNAALGLTVYSSQWPFLAGAGCYFFIECIDVS